MYEVLWTDSDSSPLVTRCHMDSHSPGLQDYSGLLLLLLSDSLCTLSERAGIGKKQKKVKLRSPDWGLCVVRWGGIGLWLADPGIEGTGWNLDTIRWIIRPFVGVSSLTPSRGHGDSGVNPGLGDAGAMLSWGSLMCPGHNAYAIVTYIHYYYYTDSLLYGIHTCILSISAKSGQVDMVVYLNEVHLGPWSAGLC